jgi:UPF0176 protein
VPATPFYKLIVRAKQEIVALKSNKPLDPAAKTGAYIEPEEMREILRQQPDDVVIIDTRSDYEFKVGRFKGAITVPIENFRELPAFFDELRKFEGKKLVTYCTGGIRCEKLTALMLEEGFEDVAQLHGGIIRYAHETGGEDFEGELYVFDDRVTVPVNAVNPTVIGECERCGAHTSKVINCANALCHKRTVICDACAEEFLGTCSDPCLHAPTRRPWNGLGVYHRFDQNSPYQEQLLAEHQARLGSL